MSATVYRRVRHPRGGVRRANGEGRRCLHCGRPATWTAMRVRHGMELPVAYCDVHAGVAGVAK